MRPLIAYYSWKGENLVDGRIQMLQVGNTELVAAILQKYTGGDCFKIEACIEYPEDYCHCIDLARQDIIRQTRPEIKNCLESIKKYDVIYLGYPNY